jgi:shikimate kinase
MHLVLIGLRGAGKSTAGRATADLLARPFIDLDDRTAELCGMDATTCFSVRGEAAWREAEATALHAALMDPTPAIIALGGGTPTAPGAEDLLQNARRDHRIRVVWLDAPPEVLAERIGHDPSRPPLTDLDPLAEMRAIDARRRPIFARLADTTIDVADATPSSVLGALIATATRG